MIDPADRVLLVQFSFEGRIVWACPGGGLEDGEADDAAILRELDEEVGLSGFTLGPCVWTREHVIPLFGGRWDGQRERFYLVRTDWFEPRPRFTAEELAAEGMVGMRWWALEELRTSDQVFAPRRLAQLLQDLRADGPPEAPVDAGV